jgi:hypothetical protein
VQECFTGTASGSKRELCEVRASDSGGGDDSSLLLVIRKGDLILGVSSGGKTVPYLLPVINVLQ